MPTLSLAENLAVWRTMGPGSSVSPPASEFQLLDAEKALGFRLPRGLRELYTLANGAILESGWQILPLTGAKTSGRDPFTGQLREFTTGGLVDNRLAAFDDEMDGHENLLMIGDDGSDAQFALWLPSGDAEPTKVVMIGEHDLRLSDLAAHSIAEWCAVAVLVNLDIQVQLKTARPESLQRLGLPSGNPDQTRAGIQQRLDETAFAQCDCFAEGRSFERTRKLAEA